MFVYISKSQQIEDKCNASYSVYFRALYKEIIVFQTLALHFPLACLTYQNELNFGF